MKARLLMEMAAPGARVLDVAQRHGISPSLLHRWRRKAEGHPERRMARQASSFVPLLVETSPATGVQKAADPVASGTGTSIEVVLRNGRVLQVFGNVDAVAVAKTPEERERIQEQAVEVRSDDIPPAQFAAVEQGLKDAPPVRFDVARQVWVFEPYLQYVELHLTGAAIQRRKLAIPKVIQNLGAAERAQTRLNTTFDLIERESELSQSISRTR